MTGPNRFRFRAWCEQTKEMMVCGEKPLLAEIGRNGLRVDLNFGFAGKYPCIIMQSTGLTDKNGVEIFEGDVVRRAADSEVSESVGVVKYGGMAFHYAGTIKNPPRYNPEGIWFDTITNPHIKQDRYTEVIGNIYENPELLK